MEITNFTRKYLKIVLKINNCFTKKLFLTREWPLLRNLPDVTVLGGSPINRADLRAVKVNLCRSCIILSAKEPDKLEPVLADKEIIMAALNIKSMDFRHDQDTDLEQIKVAFGRNICKTSF